MYVGTQARYKEECLVKKNITMRESYFNYKIINNVSNFDFIVILNKP